MTRAFARHESHREHLEYNEEFGYQMLCKKWIKRVCESWYSVPPNVIEEFYKMPRRNADLIKAKGAATKYWLYM